MDRTIVHQWLLDLYAEWGALTPRVVKDAARDPESPAHGFVFNLPPDEAAEAYYEERARKLLRSIKVDHVARQGEEPREIRAFYAIPEDGEYRFEPVEALVRRPDRLLLARQEARRRVLEAEHAVEDLDAIAPDRKRTSAALGKVREANKLLADEAA